MLIHSPGGKRRYRKYSLSIGNLCYLLEVQTFYTNYFSPHSYFCTVLTCSCNSKSASFSKEGWTREPSKTQYLIGSTVTCPE